MKKSAVRLMLSFALLAGAGGLAFAHAHLLTSTPQAGAMVRGPEIVIDLKFNSRVDSARSHLDLVLPDGSVKPLTITAPSDGELASKAKVGAGKYTIRWQALSTDGHLTRGEIPFSVR